MMSSSDFYHQESHNTDDGILMRNIHVIVDAYNLDIEYVDIIIVRGTRLSTPFFRVDLKYTKCAPNFMATAIGEGKDLQQQIISMFRDLKKRVDNVVAPLVPWPGIEKEDKKQPQNWYNIQKIQLPNNILSSHIDEALEQETLDDFDPPPSPVPPTPPQKLKPIPKPTFDDGTHPRKIYLD
jgi:hypothetical protein